MADMGFDEDLSRAALLQLDVPPVESAIELIYGLEDQNDGQRQQTTPLVENRIDSTQQTIRQENIEDKLKTEQTNADVLSREDRKVEHDSKREA
jgi:hypothetical protein